MQITIFSNAKNTVPALYESDWDWMCDTIPLYLAVKLNRSAKLDHSAMIFGECDGPRAKANVRSLSGLAADFDLPSSDPRYVSFSAMCERLEDDGYAFIAYTTTANDEGENRYRLLMPYAHDVPFALCQPAWFACNAKFGGAIDPSTKDESRLSFLPADWQENPYSDPRKGEVTLTAPFNEVRVNRAGKPILSDVEIAALVPFATRRTTGIAPSRVRTSGVSATLCTDFSALERGVTNEFSWQLLSDLRNSSLVTDAMLKPDTAPNDRVWRFMGQVAGRAVRNQTPINLQCLVALATQFCRECLNRDAPDELARRACDALEFAIRNAGDDPSLATVSAGEC